MSEKLYKFFSILCYILFGFSLLAGIPTFSAGGVIILFFGALFLWIAILCGGLSKPTEIYKEDPPTLAPTITPQLKKEPPKIKNFFVTGISFYRENILNLASENPDYDLGTRAIKESGLENERIYKYEFYPSRAELVPEPDNPHDRNAVKVIVDGEHIGYIKAGSCSQVLNLLAGDLIKKIDCEIYGGEYKILYLYDDEDPGEIEKESTEFGAKIIITLK